MNQKDHQQDLRELRVLIRREQSAVQRDRYRTVLLVLQGHSTLTAAEMIGRSQRFVQKWVGLYRDQGIAALAVVQKRGRRPKLDDDEFRQLESKLITLSADLATKGQTLTAEQVRKLLVKEFGIEYSTSSVYFLLKRIRI